MHIIKRGAEAVLYLEELDGRKVLVKERLVKGYRIPELDNSIRSFRTKREEKLLAAAQRSGVDAPRVLMQEKTRLVMEFLDGPTVKEYLSSAPKSERMRVYKLMGESLANLHRNGVVHGDLTTSNMILKDGKLFVIDFGLGKFSNKVEDQAVDLYLLREALLSTHFKHLDEAWGSVIKIYMQKYSNSPAVIRRFEKIESRRRYKSH
jgi:TP53 regulating kinase-like protein